VETDLDVSNKLFQLWLSAHLMQIGDGASGDNDPHETLKQMELVVARFREWPLETDYQHVAELNCQQDSNLHDAKRGQHGDR
jgi:hypothetical protein